MGPLCKPRPCCPTATGSVRRLLLNCFAERVVRAKISRIFRPHVTLGERLADACHLCVAMEKYPLLARQSYPLLAR
jgi:hypothetical protein